MALSTVHGHTGAVTSAAFSYDTYGERLLTSSRDGTIRIWTCPPLPVETWTVGEEVACVGLLTIDAHSGPVRQLALSPDSSLIVAAAEGLSKKHSSHSAQQGGVISVWDARSCVRQGTFLTAAPAVCCAVAAEGPHLLAAGDSAGQVRWGGGALLSPRHADSAGHVSTLLTPRPTKREESAKLQRETP